MALDKIKLIADIAKIGSEIYATVIDKTRGAEAKKRRIEELERELAQLKMKKES